MYVPERARVKPPVEKVRCLLTVLASQ